VYFRSAAAGLPAVFSKSPRNRCSSVSLYRSWILRGILAAKARRSFELGNARVERAILVVGRAETRR
jgi:hypothetical protein